MQSQPSQASTRPPVPEHLFDKVDLLEALEVSVYTNSLGNNLALAHLTIALNDPTHRFGSITQFTTSNWVSPTELRIEVHFRDGYEGLVSSTRRPGPVDHRDIELKLRGPPGPGRDQYTLTYDQIVGLQ